MIPLYLGIPLVIFLVCAGTLMVAIAVLIWREK